MRSQVSQQMSRYYQSFPLLDPQCQYQVASTGFLHTPYYTLTGPPSYIWFLIGLNIIMWCKSILLGRVWWRTSAVPAT